MQTPPTPIHKFFASRPTRALLIVLGIVILVAAASYFTTVIYTAGDLPAGWYRLHISNAAGKPIVGAEMNIYAGTDHYPGKFRYGDLWTSGPQGYVEFVRDPDGGTRNERGWLLFWVYPILPHDDSLVWIEISAPGYQTLTIPETDFFKFVLTHPHRWPQAASYKYDGAPVQVDLHELYYTLQATK